MSSVPAAARSWPPRSSVRARRRSSSRAPRALLIADERVLRRAGGAVVARDVHRVLEGADRGVVVEQQELLAVARDLRIPEPRALDDDAVGRELEAGGVEGPLDAVGRRDDERVGRDADRTG